MHRFKELKIWQKAMEVTKQVYKLTCDLPKEEMYGLNQQMRRSAVSIPSNIAEGTASNSNKEFGRFLGMANGSLHELETQLCICESLEFFPEQRTNHIQSNITELQKMMYAFRKNIQEKSNI